MSEYLQLKKQAKPVKRLLAAVAVIAVAGVAIGAPLSIQAQQAYAEVVPLAIGERMNQKLMAKASAQAEFTVPEIQIQKVPETAKPKNTPGAAAAPAAGTPDPGSAQAIARSYVGDDSEYNCLYALWQKESHWNVYAHNRASGAYGIPQSLPGNKMASAGADWQTNPETQIRWGLGYIKNRYGSPCAAWGHSQARGWY